MLALLLPLALATAVAVGISLSRASGISPLRARIVALAESQVGYRTDPVHSYCNKFSAYWDAGLDRCANANR